MAVNTILEEEKLKNKRSHIYAFSSRTQLKGYFSAFLPSSELQSIMTSAHQNFAVREGATNRETELQYIKKCEIMILKKLRAGQ